MASFIANLYTTKLFEAIFLLFDKTSSHFQYKIRWDKMRIKSEKTNEVVANLFKVMSK